jgi:hypothetical protein
MRRDLADQALARELAQALEREHAVHVLAGRPHVVIGVVHLEIGVVRVARDRVEPEIVARIGVPGGHRAVRDAAGGEQRDAALGERLRERC